MPGTSSPPVLNAPDAERSVLGMILLDPSCLYEVADRLTEASFSTPGYRAVWRAVASLLREQTRISLETVFERIQIHRDDNRVTPADLIDIISDVYSAAHLGAHSALLLRYQQRRMLRDLHRRIDEGLQTNPEELLDQVEIALADIRAVGTQETDGIEQQVQATIAADIAVSEGKIPAYRWPIRELTRATKGIQPGRFYLIIALYKTGKSKLVATTLTDLVVNQQVPCLFFSMEMRPRQVLHWMAGQALRIDTLQYDTPDLSRKDMQATHDWLVREIASKKLLFINDRSRHTPESICGEMRRSKLRYGIKVAFIDFLQKIDWGQKDIVTEIEKGVNLIAATGRDLGVAIIGLSQAPKAAEFKGPKQNLTLADVKSSGALAEAADCAIAITDPDRHKETEDGIKKLRFLVEGRDIRSRILEIRADLRYGFFNCITPEAPTAVRQP